MTKKTIGGDRLGSGKKMNVDLKTYNRSTHNLNYLWRSTMASGTLVPFMSEVGLPGDTFDIDLEAVMNTHPTIGPLFGSYKVQIDVFSCPVRLYQGQLQNNKTGIGMDMAKVKLPQMILQANVIDPTKDPDNQQMNPSSIFSYLNIRGVAGGSGDVTNTVARSFNACAYLAYWDIYKNYYANKQEEVGAVIHNPRTATDQNVASVIIKFGSFTVTLAQGDTNAPQVVQFGPIQGGNSIEILSADMLEVDINDIKLLFNQEGGSIDVTEIMQDWFWDQSTERAIGTNSKVSGVWNLYGWQYKAPTDIVEDQPQITFFPLENIDNMREDIMAHTKNPSPYIINNATYEPYGLALKGTEGADGSIRYSKMSSQEGLAIKTYQNDLFNNWMNTEWIDGENGINAITAIDVSGGSLQIDALLLGTKVYEMLTRIAISGGSYDDWQEAVYSHKRMRQVSSPVYQGGLMKELVFQEVVSNAATQVDGEQPLGTLAGKGVMTGKKKGGNVTIKIDEPSYIIGIVSLTPRIDYSQGNKWDTSLKTMDDFHKPALDEIGFQDLITEQMAWWTTTVTPEGEEFKKSAGKQPAWINYMTNVNQVRGNFAIEAGTGRDGGEMFMTLNRKYELEGTDDIKDLTTYIDPVKFNQIFAQSSRDAQNFWMQIAIDITARRKMSAKIMPNL